MDEIIALRNRYQSSTHSKSNQTTNITNTTPSIKHSDEDEEVEIISPLVSSASDHDEKQLLQQEDNNSKNEEVIIKTRKEILSQSNVNPPISETEKKYKIWKNIFKYRFYMIVLWICFIYPIGLFCQPKIMKVTISSSYTSIVKHTASYDANEIYQTYYLPNNDDDNNNNLSPIIILLEQKDTTGSENMIDGASQLYKSTKLFINNYARYIRDYCKDNDENCNNNNNDIDQLITVENYYDYELLNLYKLGQESYMRNNGTSMLMIITSTNNLITHSKDIYDFLNDIKDYGNTFTPKEITISYTGLYIFQQDMIISSIHDNLYIIITVLPILILLSTLTCFKLRCNTSTILIMILPITMNSVTMTFWCIFIWPLVHYYNYQIHQITSTIIWCICITISFQYCYMLIYTISMQLKSKQSLLYYNQIHNNNQSMNDSMYYSNSIIIHDIIITSLNKITRNNIILHLSLFLIFFGYMLLSPITILSNSFGLSIYISIIGSLLCSITLIPSILFTKFGYNIIINLSLLFDNDDYDINNPYCCLRRKKDNNENNNNNSNDVQLIEPLLNNTEELLSSSSLQYFPIDSIEVMDRNIIDTTIEETLPIQPKQLKHEDVYDNKIEDLQNSSYFVSSKKFINDGKKSSAILFFITLLFIAPSIYFLTKFKNGVSVQLTLPTDSTGLDTYDTMSDIYNNKGYLYPYKIIFDGTSTKQKITSQEGFNTMHYVYQQLSTRTNERSDNDIYLGISILNQTLISYNTYEKSIQCGIYCNNNEEYATIAYIDSNFTANDDGYVTYISLVLETDVFAYDGIQWLIDARNIIQELKDDNKLNDYDVYIQGGASSTYDTMDRLYTKILPRFIPITSVIVLSFLSIVYKSIIVTMIRCIISALYTFVFTFGFTVLVYQYGCLHWLHTRSLSNDINEIYFITPIVAFGIIFGMVCINYYIHTISYILQYRLAGYYYTSSILLGIQTSYCAITILECVMLIIFGSLLFITTNMALNQLSFMIVIATIFNMFIVPFIDPIVLSLLHDKCCWWPRSKYFPLEEKDLLKDGNDNTGVDSSGDHITFQSITGEIDSLRI